MADSEPSPGNPNGGSGQSASPSSRSGSAATFQVDDKSLRSLHSTLDLLVKDFGRLNNAIVQISKSSKSIDDLNAKLGNTFGGGGSSAVSAQGNGGSSSGLGGATFTPTGSGNAGPNGGTTQFSGGSIAAQAAQQSRGTWDANSSIFDRGLGWATQNLSAGTRLGTGAAIAAGVSTGAYVSRNMGAITSLDSMYVQGAQMSGGYSGSSYQAGRAFTNSLGGYTSASDLTQGVGDITQAVGGGILDPRTASIMRDAGNLASLNPSAGYSGSASAVASLYNPVTQNRLRSYGMSPQGSRGALQSPQQIYQGILQKSFGGQKITSAMVNQGMQPGSRLYQSLSSMGLSADAMTQFQQYGNAVVNLGGSYTNANTAMHDASIGKDSSLVKQAGLQQSIASQQAKLGRAQTQAQSETTSETADSLRTSLSDLAGATDTVTRMFRGLSGMTGGESGNVAGVSSVLTGKGGIIKKTTSASRSFINFDLVKGAIGGAARGGGVSGAVRGGLSGGLGGSGIEGTPVYVVNWPGGGYGGSGGGGNGIGNLLKKGGRAGQAAEDAEGVGSEVSGFGGMSAGLEGTGALAGAETAGASGLSGLAGGALGMVTAGGVLAAGAGAAGFFAGRAITHIGRHNGKDNKAARVGGDTLAGAAVGASIGSVVPIVGTGLGAAIGGGIGFIKGGGVGDTVGLGEDLFESPKHDNKQYEAQYNSLLASAHARGMSLVPGWVNGFGSVNALAQNAIKRNRKKAWEDAIKALTALNSKYSSRAASANGAVGRGADGQTFNSVYAQGQYAPPGLGGAGSVSIGVGSPGGAIPSGGGSAGNASPTSQATGSAGEVNKAIHVAESFVGRPYKWGGSNPKTSFDCIAEGTLVATARGDVPIEDVSTDDWVLTRAGYRRVTRAWLVRQEAVTVDLTLDDGRVLRGTPDHRVWTENRGWVPLAEVAPFDTLVSCPSQSESSSVRSPTTGIQTLIDPLFAPTSSDLAGRCTERCGSQSTAASLLATRSTTSTTTRSTTTSRTSRACRRPSTVRRAKRRAACTTTPARSVESSSAPSAPLSASVDSAASGTSRSSTTTSAGPRCNVYDLSVEGVHEFFANGVLVHNCSGLMQWSWGQAGVKLPRTAAQQQQVGTDVPLNQLVPGDLIFYGQPAEHVTMYVGNGQMVEAPHTGADIRVTGYRTGTNAKRVAAGGAGVSGPTTSTTSTTSGSGSSGAVGDSGTAPFGAGSPGGNVTGGGDAMTALASVLAPPSLFGGGVSTSLNNSGGTDSASSGTASSATGNTTSNGSGGPPTTPVGGTIGQWVSQALGLLHLSFDKYGADIETIIQHESSGNPHAINNWDSNAKAGHPSEGIMQTIPSTFAAHALPGHTDIWNPVDNIASATRYAIARYGSIDRVPGILSLNSGHGYKGYGQGSYKTAEGMAMLHNDEMIVPAGAARKVRRAIEATGQQPTSPATTMAAGAQSRVVHQWNVTAQIALHGTATQKDASDFMNMLEREADKRASLDLVMG
jgi:SLT domain-containing protein/cell wall-associated NlpC family hydrolase